MNDLVTAPRLRMSGNVGDLSMSAISDDKRTLETLIPFAAFYLAMKRDGPPHIEDYLLDYYEIDGVKFHVYGEDCKAVYDLLSKTMGDGEILEAATKLRGSNDPAR